MDSHGIQARAPRTAARECFRQAADARAQRAPHLLQVLTQAAFISGADARAQLLSAAAKLAALVLACTERGTSRDQRVEVATHVRK